MNAVIIHARRWRMLEAIARCFDMGEVALRQAALTPEGPKGELIPPAEANRLEALADQTRAVAAELRELARSP